MNKIKNIYNFQKNCPSVSHYEAYLNKTGESEFMEAFEKHLTNCQICQLAIEGFKSNNIYNLNECLKKPNDIFISKIRNTKRIRLYKLAYAASAIIIIGISIFTLSQKSNNIINTENSFTEYSIIDTEPLYNQKILSKKSTDQYIYINNCNQIAYNDQFLTADELKNALKSKKDISSIRIEVGTTDFNCASIIINNVKQIQSVPILTIRNLKSEIF